MSDAKSAYLSAPTGLDADGICQSQTPGGAGNLTINGVLASAGSVTLTSARQITIAGTGNEAGKTFTITGTDINGDAQVEAIAGPNNNTVTTTNYFLTITQIAVSAATAAAITVGIPLDFAHKLYASRCRLVGVHTVNSATAGTFTFVDGDPVSGSTLLTLDTVASATTIDDFCIGGNGILFGTSLLVLGDATDMTSMVVIVA